MPAVEADNRLLEKEALQHYENLVERGLVGPASMAEPSASLQTTLGGTSTTSPGQDKGKGIISAQRSANPVQAPTASSLEKKQEEKGAAADASLFTEAPGVIPTSDGGQQNGEGPAVLSNLDQLCMGAVTNPVGATFSKQVMDQIDTEGE